MDIEKFMDSLSDEQLIAHAKECESDLKEVSTHNPNSEWHEACFAGMMRFAQELNKRGLKLVTIQ